MILKWLQLPLLFLISHLFLHSTRAVFLLWGLHIFRIFSDSFFPEIAMYPSIHVYFSLSWIMMSGYCWEWFCQFALFDSKIWLPCLLAAYFGTCTYQCFTHISLHMLKCSWAHTLSSLFMDCSFTSTGHANIMWSIV
jgi:hypothetical protein